MKHYKEYDKQSIRAIIESGLKRDLHMHTCYSDGELTPEEIIDLRMGEGYELLAITDHDGDEGSRVGADYADKAGISYISGIELDSVDKLGKDIHILGYGFDYDYDGFQKVLWEIRHERAKRNDKLMLALNEMGYGITLDDIFSYKYGSFVLELSDDTDVPGATLLGTTTDSYELTLGGETIDANPLSGLYEDKLESVFHCNIETENTEVPTFDYVSTEDEYAKISVARPKALIPVFPGTNCEYDTAKAFERAGADAEVYVINNLTASDIERSVTEFAAKAQESQIIFIPGGFSGGDEPDGSGKFITAFFRNPEIKDKVTDLLDDRGGLVGGICNGFQALIKLGLVPYGKIIDTDADCPTLTFNTINRHQSEIVRVRLDSNKGPWLKFANVGDIYNVPISHGEGRILASEELLLKLAENGQILTQYVDLEGRPTMDIAGNPNGSVFAVEGLLSPNGHVFGKMGHSERIGANLYKNVPGEYDMKLFESAVAYFKKG